MGPDTYQHPMTREIQLWRFLLRKGRLYILQNRLMAGHSCSRTDLSYDFYGAYSNNGVTVEDGDPDLELRNLSVEVPCDQPLAEQFGTINLRLDRAREVVSIPSSLEGVAKVF